MSLTLVTVEVEFKTSAFNNVTLLWLLLKLVNMMATFYSAENYKWPRFPLQKIINATVTVPVNK